MSGAADPDDAAWVAAYRERVAGAVDLAGELPTLASIADGRLETAAGALPVRTYVPPEARSGTILYLHGGGLIGGSIDSHHPAVAQLAGRTRRRIVSLGYRLAPEHPWPAGLEDAAAAIASLRPDAVAGDSAGGLLALSASRLAMERGLHVPRAIVALYPNADLREGRAYPSMDEFDGHVIELADLDRGLGLAFPAGFALADGMARDGRFASPAVAPDHSGLPPILVVTVQNDPLRDEGERLVERLYGSGVAVSHWRVPHALHGLLQTAGRDRRSVALQDRVAGFLDAVLG